MVREMFPCLTILYKLKKQGDYNLMKISTKQIAIAGVTAAVYFVTTVFLAPLSYMEIQFRFSEILNLLAFIHPAYAVGVTLGCMISNMFSPFGLIDIIFGTLATGLATFAITRTKSLLIASLWPTIFSLIVAAEISILSNLPFLLTACTILLGEFVVVTVIGYPLFAFILLKNKSLVNILKG